MALLRKFTFNGAELPDPDPDMNVDDVRALYASQHPELASAVVVFKDPKNGEQEYELKPTGRKGKASAAAAISGRQEVEFKTSVGRKG